MPSLAEQIADAENHLTLLQRNAPGDSAWEQAETAHNFRSTLGHLEELKQAYHGLPVLTQEVRAAQYLQLLKEGMLRAEELSPHFRQAAEDFSRLTRSVPWDRRQKPQGDRSGQVGTEY